MSKEPIISVIVPIYNVEAYLPKCLDSLINQSLRDIEVICIDDGSTDDSGAIAEGYAGTYEGGYRLGCCIPLIKDFRRQGIVG